jgi:hypothetical protein
MSPKKPRGWKNCMRAVKKFKLTEVVGQRTQEEHNSGSGLT